MNKELWMEAAKKAGYKTPQEIANEEEVRRAYQVELENAKNEIKEFWEGEEGQVARVLLHCTGAKIILADFYDEPYSWSDFAGRDHIVEYIDGEGFRQRFSSEGVYSFGKEVTFLVGIERIVEMIATWKKFRVQEFSPNDVLSWLKNKLDDIAEGVKNKGKVL